MINRSLFTSARDDWETPQSLFDALNAEFNFDIDVAATADNAKCATYFDVEKDGLAQDWSGHRCFCNPPYGRKIAKWVKKAHDEALRGALVVMLIPARTDTRIWHEYIFGQTEVRFLRGRLHYTLGGEDRGPAAFPTAVVIFGRIPVHDKIPIWRDVGAKPILDACCGGRLMWFDKQNSAVEFCDIRRETHIAMDRGKERTIEIAPDTIADFRHLPFADESFVHVVMDPPHLTDVGPKSYLGYRYGRLSKNWEADIRQGFAECMRVLKPWGTLIFKWSEAQVPLSQVLACIEWEPLYGQRTSRRSHTHWLAFVKGVSARREHVQEVMVL